MHSISHNPNNFQITYIIGTYPGLTTTFIDREIRTLRRLGVRVRILSIRHPWTSLSPEQVELQAGVIYLLPLNLLSFLWGHLRMALLHPRRYFGTLSYLLSRPHPNLKSRLMTLLHFGEGIYAAHKLHRDPGDHLHAHFIDRAATVALTVSRLLGVPYSVTAHASDIYVSPVLLREKLSGAKFVATCTAYNRSYLAQFGENLFNHKLMCIYHGLEAARYRRKTSARADKPVILTVGQLKERKGFQYLVEACGLLRDRGVSFECRIIGEGPLRPALEAQIHQSGLDGIVVLCGALPHEQVIAEYEAATVFTLPAILGSDGDRDGIPNVILEAMAMELPVISTLHSGVPEVVEDGVNGLLVAPADASALADAFVRLFGNPEQRLSFGQAGRITISEKFDPEKNIRQLMAAFTG